MISKNLEKEFNKQINAELFSAYLYQSMGAYFSSVNLSGFANWMDVQAEEECMHARKFYDYIIERGGKVKLQAIEEPKSEWNSTLEVFEAAYEHEQKITSLINKLVDIAEEEKDHASKSFLQWFIDEQVEEEASVDEIVQKLKMIGDSANGIFMLDSNLGQRTIEVNDSE